MIVPLRYVKKFNQYIILYNTRLNEKWISGVHALIIAGQLHSSRVIQLTHTTDALLLFLSRHGKLETSVFRLPAFPRLHYLNLVFDKTRKLSCALFWSTIFPFNWIWSKWVYLSCDIVTLSKKPLILLAVICLTSIATWGTNNMDFLSDVTRDEKHLLPFIDS